MEHLLTIAGWAGAAMLLLAYAFVSARKIDPTGTAFQVLNLAGSIGLTANSSYHRAWPSAALNIAWILIGLVALHRVGNPIRKAGGSRHHR
jgi:hypothetical protein